MEASAGPWGKIVRVVHERGPISSLCKSEAVEIKVKDPVGVHAGNYYILMADGCKAKPGRRDLREATKCCTVAVQLWWSCSYEVLPTNNGWLKKLAWI